MHLVPVGKNILEEFGRSVPDKLKQMPGGFHVTKRVMRVMILKSVRRRESIQPEDRVSGIVHRPIEGVVRAVIHRIQDLQDIQSRVPVELGCKDIRLKRLVEGLPQEVLVEAHRVVTGPCGRGPRLDEALNLLHHFEPAWQRRIRQLVDRDSGDSHCPWRRQYVRSQPTAHVHAFQRLEVVICKECRKLQGLIVRGRRAGGLKVVEGERHRGQFTAHRSGTKDHHVAREIHACPLRPSALPKPVEQSSTSTKASSGRRDRQSLERRMVGMVLGETMV